MGKLRIGKTRGLQQIANAQGIFTMCAMDHRGSLEKMIDSKNPGSVGYDQMVERKRELCGALAPYSSAVLLDPDTGAAQCISSGDLPGGVGLLVSMEASGYGGGAEGRVTELLPGWNASKIRRMGGSAGKLLLYFRPDLKDLAAKQLEVVKKAAADCEASDLAFLVEPKTYPVGDEIKRPELLAKRLPDLVIDTARMITPLNIDVLKAEFPADMKYEKDDGKLLDYCRRLNEASRAPWVVLSAGVDYETFAKQVEIACRAGASGFLGGRAIWQEVMPIKDKKERVTYLRTTVADRMKRLDEIATKYGTPWHKKTGATSGKTGDIPQKWYEGY
ncbi:MAG: tagatose 1,6-diphosphate aldolase [Chloroflexi bacterium]|nr:tagatose 1,6-diphosphate aldolase [Chloroflexota bacterium]